MKKLFRALTVLLAGLFLFGLNNQKDEERAMQTFTPLVGNDENLKIWMVTDIHYLSPDLFDDGEAFARMQATSAGKDLKHVPEMMEALVWEAAKEQPDLLIVSGDLTFNGEYQSMVELAAFFERIEKNGTQVSVIPGNHDIHSGWARKFEGEEMAVVAQATPEDFQEIFADYGYDLAISKDPESLSYVMEPKAGFPFLMIDTNIYSEKKSTKAPTTEGRIKDEAYAWLDGYFELQDETVQAVQLIGHHPLLNHTGRLGGGFVLENAEEAIDYFAEKGIQTSFAGHIHAQDISEAADTQTPFYEVVTGALSIFPNAIGEITLSDEELAYQRKSLDVEGWAEATGVKDPELLAYTQTAHDLFKRDGENLALQMMFEEQWYEEAYEAAVMDYVGRMNVRFFSGEDYIEDESLLDEWTSHAGYQIIQQNSESFLKKYTSQLLQDKNLEDQNIVIPQHQ
ncbi:MAG: hypothetical protein PWP61_570 [Trichococcus sp.]|jgi:3',5'-cyclic AMP phosphodiesterase CpdA|nr:hypothetical protein [Trichococcus sp.]